VALVMTTVLLTAALALALGEGMARLAGVSVFHARGTAYIGWAKPDPILGWRNHPGVFPADEPPHELMTFLPDGSRVTGTPVTSMHSASGRPNVLIVGCSFAEGYGVRDDESLAWLLQKRFPDLRIWNFGTPGYGTYQSLLLLREAIEQRHIHPAAVIYGLVPFHAERNVLTYGMLDAFRAFGADRFSPPHAEMASGTLRYFPPFIVTNWPLEEHSALVTLLHRTDLRVRLAKREKDEVEVTDLLLEKMKELADREKAPLLVADLWNGGSPGPEALRSITKSMREEGIEQMDVTYGGTETRPELLHVGGSGHPGVAIHAWWADKIGDWLARQHLGIHG
jgi:hypothetical protein